MIARFTAGAVGTALALALAAPAYAADPSSAELRDQLDALQRQIIALQQQLEDQQARIDASEKASTDALATATQAKESADKVKVSWKGAPEISGEGGWSFKPRGRFQYDLGYVDAPDGIVNDGLGFSNEVRRVRLGAEGTIPGGFGYRVELEFAGGNTELFDAYLNYKTGGLTLTAGQHNNFQSLDELTSGNDTVLLERAAFTDAFNFERRLGLSAQYGTGDFLLQGGVFTDNAADLGDDGNNSVGLDGRVVFAPKLGEAQLHLAGSAHWRDLGDTITTARYRQRPHIHSTDVRFIDTGTLAAAKSETHYGLEAAVISGPFHAAGEAHWLKTSRIGLDDPGFFGAYAEVGYFLTGDTLGYRGGVFRAPKITKPVGDGGIGAVQLTARYDRLDLNDESAGVIGGKQDAIIAGLSWWPVDFVRVIVNYAHLEYEDAVLAASGNRDYSVDTVGGRFQVAF